MRAPKRRKRHYARKVVRDGAYVMVTLCGATFHDHLTYDPEATEVDCATCAKFGPERRGCVVVSKHP